MKEYKLVQYGGKVEETTPEQAGSVYKTFSEGTTGVQVDAGIVGGGAEEGFGVNTNVIGGQVGGVNNTALPQKVGLWGKIKNFLFQEIDLNKEITFELTPKEKKVLKEVHDFWFQDIHFPELHDFLFQEITIFGKKK